MRKIISIMTPCLNEEDNIEECYAKVKAVFEEELSEYDYEHIFIDNASVDRTVAILKALSEKDPRVKVIVNSRNFGPHRSPYYGILQMSGCAVIPVVADLQTPPNLIVDFVRLWEKGFKVVLGVRTHMEEGVFIRGARNLFYKMMTTISNIEQVQHFIGYGIFDREVVEIMKKIDDPYPYFRGIIAEIGFEKAIVEYKQPPRLRGESRHSFLDLIEFAILGLSSYSRLPLRLITLTGVMMGVISFVIAIGYLLAKLLYWETFTLGIAPVLIGVFFFGGIQLVCLGFVGEYIGMIFDQVRKRPLVVEEERINF